MNDQRTNPEGSVKLTVLSAIFTVLISGFNLIAFFIGSVGMLTVGAFNWLKKFFPTR